MLSQTVMDQYRVMRQRADRIRAMQHRRAVIAYYAALGTPRAPSDGSLCMCVIHNSLLAREDGKPWKGVDYSSMRLARRLVDDWRASDICAAWFKRKWNESRIAA